MSPHPEGHGASVDSAAPSGYTRRTRKSCDESKEAEERKIERDLLERGREGERKICSRVTEMKGRIDRPTWPLINAML